MKKFKPVLLMLPFILASCGPTATPLSLEEGKAKLDEIHEYWKKETSLIPSQIVTRKTENAWSEALQKNGTYTGTAVYDNERPNNVMGYSKEVLVNYNIYTKATIETWYLISPDEKTGAIYAKSEIPSLQRNLTFDLTEVFQRTAFVEAVDNNIISVASYTSGVSKLFSQDIEMHNLGNTYSFSTTGKDLIVDASNTRENLVESNHIVIENNLITSDHYKKALGGAVMKEYNTTYTLEKGTIPSLPDVKFF